MSSSPTASIIVTTNPADAEIPTGLYEKSGKDGNNSEKMRIFAAIMTQEEKTQIEERIVDVLKTVYDPEIPVNIYDLGMIYKIDVQEDYTVNLDMTFTAPNCPAADYILEDVRTKVESLDGVKSANVNLVFEPAWDQSMMSEEARVELGFD
jgi:FeS assembly SUF system protein